MQIDWIPSDGSEKTILCHGPNRGAGLATGPYRMEVSEQVDTQVAKRIRASKARVFDRGNMLHQLTFRVTAKYDNEVEAVVAHHTHRDRIARKGKLVLRLLPGTKRIEYHDALIEITGRDRTGVSIAWAYQVVASTIHEIKE